MMAPTFSSDKRMDWLPCIKCTKAAYFCAILQNLRSVRFAKLDGRICFRSAPLFCEFARTVSQAW